MKLSMFTYRVSGLSVNSNVQHDVVKIHYRPYIVVIYYYFLEHVTFYIVLS